MEEQPGANRCGDPCTLVEQRSQRGAAAVVIIDFQPVQVSSIASCPKRELVSNITALAQVAQLYEMPIVRSTVNGPAA